MKVIVESGARGTNVYLTPRTRYQIAFKTGRDGRVWAREVALRRPRPKKRTPRRKRS